MPPMPQVGHETQAMPGALRRGYLESDDKNPPVNAESIESINSETLKTLVISIQGLEALLQKHVGPRPQAPSQGAEASQPSLRNDAMSIRSMAFEIGQRIQTLHEILGY